MLSLIESPCMIQLPLRLAAASLLLWPLAACGSTVTTFTDEDNGSLGGGTGVSLREAVKYSPAGATITFAPALSGQTIRLTLGELLIAQSLNIDGSALAARITLSGDKTGNGKTYDDTRIINITSGTVLLDSLILDRGYWTSGDARYGGAIHVNNTVTQLTLRNSTISNNESTTYGGGIYFSGDLTNPNFSLTVQKCNFTGNRTGHDGGAIHMTGTLRVQDSVFSGNTADQGCAIFHSAGVATVQDSTFTGNAAYGYGGAVYNNATFTLRRSTVAGNSSSYGGGIYSKSGASSIDASTVSGNTSILGGGIYHVAGTLDVVRSTISGNLGTSAGGGIHGESNNLVMNTSIVAGNSSPSVAVANISGSFTGTNNLTSGVPRLAPLGDYGGPTHTMPPLPGSPAINTGNTTTPTADQRGFPRDSTPDIGAAEYQGSADLVRFWKLDFDGDGSPYGTEQALGTDPLSADPAHSRRLTAPVFNTSGYAVLTFGLAPAVRGTVWILRRSTDLLTFSEIYRYNGTTDTAAPGIIFLRTVTGVTVTDKNPFPGGAFYRFEARLAP